MLVFKSSLKSILIFILLVTLAACGEVDSDDGSDGKENISIDTNNDTNTGNDTDTNNNTDTSNDTDTNSNTIIAKGVVVEIGDQWSYRKGTSLPPSDWLSVGFDDSSWLTGNSGIGYGDDDDETVLSDMAGNYTTVYTRKVIHSDGSINITSLALEISFDDGFVAYLNGQEIARANMPAGQPSFDTLANGPVDANDSVVYDLDSFINLLGIGDNILAIEIHNVSPVSSDLSFLPRLLVNMAELPVVTITSSGGTYVEGDTVILTGTATDAEDGLITSNLTWSSSIDETITGTGGTVNTSTLSRGMHTITASVTDSDGNSASATTTIAINTNSQTAALDYDVLISSCTNIIDNTVPASQRFNGLTGGDILCLEDGNYSGGLDVPSGLTVVALNLAGAVFQGGDDEWSSILKVDGSGSAVVGLKVTRSDNSSSNACHIDGSNNVVKYTTCSHGGSYKHAIPLFIGGTGHLVEDSWFYGEGRYVAQCFKGDNMTFRRNIARWDSTVPNEPEEPNATFTNYNCSNNLWENNISLDYGVPATPMQYGGDFYSPHNPTVYPIGNINNKWYGNMAVNHATGTNNRRGFRADTGLSETLVGNEVKDFYVRDNGIGFVINPRYDFEIRNCTMNNVDDGAGYANTSGGGSPIDCGAGADIEFRYVDGVKTSESLWPFDNEDFIKADMCAAGERQSDWCNSNKSLRDYVLGN